VALAHRHFVSSVEPLRDIDGIMGEIRAKAARVSAAENLSRARLSEDADAPGGSSPGR
jgi:hypothetical protein